VHYMYIYIKFIIASAANKEFFPLIFYYVFRKPLQFLKMLIIYVLSFFANIYPDYELDFLNLLNPSGRTRHWGLLSL
jgi:hypothetical protein